LLVNEIIHVKQLVTIISFTKSSGLFKYFRILFNFMNRVKILEIKAVETDKIYVQHTDGRIEARPWWGPYSPCIASSSCPSFKKLYEHLRFEKDGVPVVREITISDD